MNAETKTPTIADEATARVHLRKTRDDLREAAANLEERTTTLVNLVVTYRPSGLLTVDEISQAIGRERSYVDTIWSAFGETTKGRQTRVTVDNPDPEAARQAYENLVDAAATHKRAIEIVTGARAERNRVVAMVYASKLLGPSAIAAEVGIDRNHVLRIARKAGIKPVHRTGAKNQYSATA